MNSTQQLSFQSLSKTSQVQSQQQKIKQKAKQLKHKLEQSKKKKQQAFSTASKDHLIQHLQTQFTNFKNQIQQQCKSQACSLELIKQFKISQINDFESVIKDAIRNLQKCREQTEEKERELLECFDNACQFVELSMKKQKDEAEKMLYQAKNHKIQQFKLTVYIE